jgi:hypothetical protein
MIDDAPDEKTAIARVIEENDIPPNERGKLIALLRGNKARGQPPRGH